MEIEVEKLLKEWRESLAHVRSESERVLSEQELYDFKTRIAILMQELDSKNKEIEKVLAEKQLIEETVERAINMEVDIKQ